VKDQVPVPVSEQFVLRPACSIQLSDVPLLTVPHRTRAAVKHLRVSRILADLRSEEFAGGT